jgi:formylglycine-generating enzyme
MTAVVIALSLLAVPVQADAAATPAKSKKQRCPDDMVSIWGKFCIDRYEAFINEVRPDGRWQRHSPFHQLNKKKRYVALNKRGRMPQAYISQKQAGAACEVAGKRLCTSKEWVQACKGKRPTTWPYGEKHQPKRCNDSGVSPFRLFFSDKNGRPPRTRMYTWKRLNDSRLNRPKGTCAPSGQFHHCRNTFRAYDMVGNLHEWVADKRGTLRGGYYLDAKINGEGCDYKTVAHGPKYHDYSTGFRCCR